MSTFPANPIVGDIYVKNNRSKDDMGHVFRSLAQVEACAPRLLPSGQADLAQAKAPYASCPSLRLQRRHAG